MNLPYIIYLFTFLGFPILGFVLSKHFDIDRNKKYLKWIGIIFGIYNMLFFYGFSISGDHPDYFIFSLEYLFLSLVISLLYYLENIYFKIIRIIGTTLLVLGFLQGVIGIVFFPIIIQEYEIDKVYSFNSSKKDYQTRRYRFSFISFDDEKFTFETYRKYKYLPIEKLINKTELYELKSGLYFRSDRLNINIKDSSNKQMLIFSSSNGNKFETSID